MRFKMQTIIAFSEQNGFPFLLFHLHIMVISSTMIYVSK